MFQNSPCRFLLVGTLVVWLLLTLHSFQKPQQQESQAKAIEEKIEFSTDHDIISKLKRGDNISIVVMGGSLATGAHGAGGYANSYPSHFVARLNSRYSSAGTGKFILHHMAHGCTHTFYSAALMPSLLPRNTSMILWGHTLNDLDFMPDARSEMMSLFIHSAKLLCPHCLLGFAYTMKYNPFPLPFLNDHFNNTWPVIANEVKDISRVFYVNYAAYKMRHNYFPLGKDSHAWSHLMAHDHILLGSLLSKAVEGVLDSNITTTTSKSSAPQPEHARDSGQFRHIFQRATSIKSLCIDKPTLDFEYSSGSHSLENITHDLTRIDYPAYVIPEACPKSSIYTFEKGLEANFLIGLGLFGDYHLHIPGEEISKVSPAPYWYCCSGTRDLPIWRYHRFRGTQVKIQLCVPNNIDTAKLRYISFLEVPSIATVH